jgi:hypothetical protein
MTDSPRTMGHQYEEWRKVPKRYVAIDASVYSQVVEFAQWLHMPVGRVISDFIKQARWDDYAGEHQQ